MKSRFKTIYALRVHCKKQNDRKCEICLQAFCKRSALKAHQEQGCERVLESTNIEPNIEDNKPTFVDCIAEPAPCLEQDINLDASFVCEIIPKESEIDDNNENEVDIERNELSDDSNHATTSADNDSLPSETSRRRRRNKSKTKTKAKKLKKGKHRERNAFYEYDNTDDANESSGSKYYCYLCNRR